VLTPTKVNSTTGIGDVQGVGAFGSGLLLLGGGVGKNAAKLQVLGAVILCGRIDHIFLSY